MYSVTTDRYPCWKRRECLAHCHRIRNDQWYFYDWEDSAASRNWMKNFWRVLPGATIRPCVRWQEKPCTAIPGEAVGPIGDD